MTSTSGTGLGSRICPRCRIRLDNLLCPTDGYLTVSTRAVNPEPDQTGKIFGSSIVLDQMISENTTTQVYAGRQLSLGRRVAVKIRKNCDARHLRGITRFQREGRSLAQFDHPRIARAVDLGVTGSGTFWLALEWLDGKTLGALISRGAFAAAPVLAVAACVADALAAVHAADIVHRHVNPNNIYVVRGDEEGAAKLLGFGLVKMPGDDRVSEDAKPVTKKGQIVGDPRYLAPEQALGSDVTPACDVYALGLTMYEMLTGGISPFKDAEAQDLVVARLTAEPQRPSVDGRQLKGALVDLVMGFIAKSPAARPKDGATALAEIRACQALKSSKQLK